MLAFVDFCRFPPVLSYEEIGHVNINIPMGVVRYLSSVKLDFSSLIDLQTAYSLKMTVEKSLSVGIFRDLCCRWLL